MAENHSYRGTFLDDLDADGLLQEPAHVIRSKLRPRLLPLYGVCTHDLLNQAREHRHSPYQTQETLTREGAKPSIEYMRGSGVNAEDLLYLDSSRNEGRTSLARARP